MARSSSTNARPATSRSSRYLTLAEVCQDLQITRSTFYDWRAKKKAPPCIKLPNGELRFRRDKYEQWLESREEAA